MSKRAPESGGQWGLLGGAFDPIHVGHLALAGDMMTACHLDGILFVPSFNPPHRKAACVASFGDRLHLLELALAPYAEYGISTIETEIEGPGYTLHVVRELKKRFAGACFHLILGADNLATFASWYQPDELIKEVDLLVGSRPGFDPGAHPGLSADRVTSVNASQVDVSSSDIRRFVAAGASLGQLSRLVPRVVAEAIVTRGLYR